jgi:hypothetical protein
MNEENKTCKHVIGVMSVGKYDNLGNGYDDMALLVDFNVIMKLKGGSKKMEDRREYILSHVLDRNSDCGRIDAYFDYCPKCGEKINMDNIKKLVKNAFPVYYNSGKPNETATSATSVSTKNANAALLAFDIITMGIIAMKNNEEKNNEI